MQEDLEGLPPALFTLTGRDSLYDEGMKYCSIFNTAGVVTECYECFNGSFFEEISQHGI